MAERTADVQAHWTRPGVLARIDAALTELGHDPQKLTPEILATVEHLHCGGLATTREQTKRVALTEDSRVLDVGCGIGGPARYLAQSYGCRVDGIDLTPELIEAGRVLTERCGLVDRVVLQLGNALDLPYPDPRSAIYLRGLVQPCSQNGDGFEMDAQAFGEPPPPSRRRAGSLRFGVVSRSLPDALPYQVNCAAA
jgi:SAM-dependent methyltransferase